MHLSVFFFKIFAFIKFGWHFISKMLLSVKTRVANIILNKTVERTAEAKINFNWYIKLYFPLSLNI